MNKYKIVFVSKESVGGTTTFINQINLLDSRKFEKFLLLFKKDSDQIEMKRQYLNYVYPKNDFGLSISKLEIFIRNFFKLYLKVIEEKPDLVIALDQYSLVLCYLLKKFLFKRLVFICLINNNLEKVFTTKTRFYALVLEKLIRSALNNYDLMLFSSDDLKDFTQERFKFENKRTVVLFPAVDFKRIRKLKKQRLEKASEEELLKRKSFKIFSIGALNSQKDFSTIIKAFSILRKRGVEAKLFIIGEGILREKLKKQAKGLRVGKLTHFWGWKKNIFSYLKFADLFLFASHYEGLGVVIVESMAMGVPVVATDTPFGPSEILERGRYGFLVPVGDYNKMADHVQLLVRDKKLRERYKKLGLKKAKEYDVRLVIKKMEGLLLSLLSR